MTADAELPDAELPDDAEHQGDNPAPDPVEPDDVEPEPEVFPRDYVDRLRRENAEHRTKATKAAEKAEQLAEQLWTERVAALGVLADPTDLPYDADALGDPAAILAAAEELLARKPHLRTRRITARVGQGEGTAGETISLAAMMRQRA